MQDYRKLKRQWYKKLKRSGFIDAETDTGILKQWNLKGEAWPVEVVWRSKRDYFIKAEHFLNKYKFKSTREEIIWAYHTEGFSTRQIAKLLTKVRIKLSHMYVWKILKRLEEQMNEGSWDK